LADACSKTKILTRNRRQYAFFFIQFISDTMCKII
jgi:hypothetical protein